MNKKCFKCDEVIDEDMTLRFPDTEICSNCYFEEKERKAKMTDDAPEQDNLEISAREKIIEVRKTMFGKEEVSNERVRIRPFVSNPANISIKAGITINLGNYESGRVDVMLSMPCYPEEIDGVYEDVKSWVDSRIEHEKGEIEKAIGRS